MVKTLSDIWGKDPLWDNMAGRLNRIIIDMQVESMDRGPYDGTLKFFAEQHKDFLQDELLPTLVDKGYVASAEKLLSVVNDLTNYAEIDETGAVLRDDYAGVVRGLQSLFQDCPPLAERRLTYESYAKQIGQRHYDAVVNRQEPKDIVGYTIPSA